MRKWAIFEGIDSNIHNAFSCTCSCIVIVDVLLYSTEEDEGVATRYADLFPGYPEHLVMPRDLADFVSIIFFALMAIMVATNNHSMSILCMHMHQRGLLQFVFVSEKSVCSTSNVNIVCFFAYKARNGFAQSFANFRIVMS